MKLTNKPTIEEIEQTIRSVAAAHSSRLFKSEVNSEERSILVYMAIRNEVSLALYDQGVSFVQIFRDISPRDEILARMVEDGYKVNLEQISG